MDYREDEEWQDWNEQWMSRLTFKSGLQKGRLGLNPVQETVIERTIAQAPSNLQFIMQEDHVRSYWKELGLISDARNSNHESARLVLPIRPGMHRGTFDGYITTPQQQGRNVGLGRPTAGRNVVSFCFSKVFVAFASEKY